MTFEWILYSKTYWVHSSLHILDKQMARRDHKAQRKRFQHLPWYVFDFIERCLQKLNDAKHWVGKCFQYLFRFCFKKTPREAWYSVPGF